MSGILFQQPLVQTLDTNANALSGAAFYFYQAGTSTPATVYSDASLTTPLTAPVLADAAGRLPNVYVDPEVVYRLSIYTEASGALIRDIDPLTTSYSASNSTFQAPGTGGASRSTAQKLADIVSTDDYSTLDQAKDAAGQKPLIDVTTGKIWLMQSSTPVFDEALDALGRVLAFDNLGQTMTVGDDVNFNYIGIRNGGQDNIHTIGDGSLVSGLSFYMTTSALSHEGSNMYGVIGALTNKGPGTSKAIYGRASHGVGATGIIMGGVFGVSPLAGGGASYNLQLSNDTIGGSSVTAYILICNNSGDDGDNATAQYGILSNKKVNITSAFIQYAAIGTGDFINLQNAAQTQSLLKVEATGCAIFNASSANAKMVDLQNGGQINFTGTSSTATGGAATLPANPVQFITVMVNGNPAKIPVYAA